MSKYPDRENALRRFGWKSGQLQRNDRPRLRLGNTGRPEISRAARAESEQHAQKQVQHNRHSIFMIARNRLFMLWSPSLSDCDAICLRTLHDNIQPENDTWLYVRKLERDSRNAIWDEMITMTTSEGVIQGKIEEWASLGQICEGAGWDERLPYDGARLTSQWPSLSKGLVGSAASRH